MSRPTALFALLAVAACAPAQVTLSTVQGGVASPAGEIVPFGAAAAGWDVADVVFNVSYSGAASPYYLTYFNLQQGTPFSTLKTDWTMLPAIIPPGGVQFTVRYRPNQVAKSDSATLRVGDAANPITVILTGQGIAGFTPRTGNRALSPGAAISFGSVQVGASQSVLLTLANQTAVPLTVGVIALVGNVFGMTGVSPAGQSVPAGGSATLQLVFGPAAAGPQQGALTVGMYSFPLSGTGLAPPAVVYPTPSVLLTPATLSGAHQANLAVNLSSASAGAGNGTVTLAFQSAVNGFGDDPAIVFADGTRSVEFTVAEGASEGRFSGEPSIAFQTGTTAGTLTFTVSLGLNTSQSTAPIPASVVAIDAAVAQRNVACDASLPYCTAVNVELQVNGWDNTRSTSEIVFHFLDSAGHAISPADIAVDAGAAFQSYFAGSSLGGVFGLSALFPITGDGSRVVAAVVEITNTAGTVESAQITF